MTDFDPDALRPMIIARKGDVRAIAEEIGADSEDLRTLIMNTPLLRRALDEVVARGVDQSLSVLFKGLDDDEHFSNQLASAKEFLKSRAAQRRGFHHAQDLELKMPRQGGALTLTWLPPESGRPEPPMIEGTVEEE
jgi:predicted RecB family endonuclease